MNKLTAVEAKIEELEARLATMTLNYHGALDLAESVGAPRFLELQSQLATAQARIEELERTLLVLAEELVASITEGST